MTKELEDVIIRYVRDDKAVNNYTTRFLNNDNYSIYPQNEIELVKASRRDHLNWLQMGKDKSYQIMLEMADRQGVKQDELLDTISRFAGDTDEFGYWKDGRPYISY